MMKIQKIIFALAFVSFLAIGCKNEVKKEITTKVEETAVVANKKELSLNISGMTCEIGCAKKIASDLSKKAGVLEANVVFNDSIANVKYDANITNKEDLITFIEGIGNGDMYKASEVSVKTCCSKKKTCTTAEKKECNAKTATKKKACTKKKGDNKACISDCKKECCAKNEADKKACTKNCKKECCSKKD
ncbi:cation transporter [Tenacibaculum aestuariivivum]|uniref:cation transporter n=1 Tax=Tenacibaculum aestuariivivum TaxID=2006131 RepID=UPI003AB8B675